MSKATYRPQAPDFTRPSKGKTLRPGGLVCCQASLRESLHRQNSKARLFVDRRQSHNVFLIQIRNAKRGYLARVALAFVREENLDRCVRLAQTSDLTQRIQIGLCHRRMVIAQRCPGTPTRKRGLR